MGDFCQPGERYSEGGKKQGGSAHSVFVADLFGRIVFSGDAGVQTGLCGR